MKKESAMRAYRQMAPRPAFAPQSTHGRTQRLTGGRSTGTTGNSPQTNHIKNITALFPSSSACSSFTDAPQPRASEYPLPALDRVTPKRVTDFTPGEIEAAPARQVLRTRMVEVG
jgi:hypothetical protein